MVGYEAWAPSNIAFLKYWGKKDPELQVPANNSISMTLSSWHSRTRVRRNPTKHRFFFAGKEVSSGDLMAQRAFRHLELIQKEFGKPGFFDVSTWNSFPTSCGIASSASGFAALTLAGVASCLGCASIEEIEAAGVDRKRLADLARLGSGSAGRSFWGGFVSWRQDGVIEPLHSAEHWQLADTLLLYADKPKEFSSRQGHGSAWSSPLFLPRLAGMSQRELEFCAAIDAKDFRRLGPLLELEALEMHGVMLSSKPSLTYLDMRVGEILAGIRKLRVEEGIEAYFTLDAGPNIHILTEVENQKKLQDRLKVLWPEYKTLTDVTGKGPQLFLVEGK